MKNLINADWLHNNLHDPNLIILDASPTTNKSNLSTNFAGLQIAGARFFDIKNKFSDKTADMPNTLPSVAHFTEACRALGINASSKIVVYDNLGIYTSPRVWWMFKAMRHEEIAVLDGGLPAWASKGFDLIPVEEKKYATGDFTAKPHAHLKRNMDDIRRNIDSKKAIVLDARSEGRFSGTAPEPRAGLSSGHIPDTLNLPFGQVLNEGKMKNPEALKAIFKDLDIDNRPLVFSCGSGLTACIIMLAADLVLDNPMSVYDGSWTEWAQKQTDLVAK